MMPRARHITLQALLLGALAVQSAAAPPPATTEIASIDLSRPFGTRSAWQFTATQAPPIPDPFGPDDGTVPGAITLCLHKGAEGPCDPQLQAKLFDTSDVPAFSERHYLEAARIVRSHGASGQPLLLIVSASLHSGDGDQLVLTQVMAYQRGQDRFTRVYEHWTGTNNNQDVRFVETGPLAGDIIAAEPSETAPYGYWVIGLRRHAGPPLPAGAALPQCHALCRRQRPAGDRLGNGQHPAPPRPLAARLAVAAAGYAMCEAASARDGAVVRVTPASG